MSDTDLELLARYARHRAEDAFAELVRRHLALVHSAALRQVRSPQLAEEVAQATFLKLAQHARQLAPGTLLSAWLYQVTRREAIDVVRREARRQVREQIATEMNAMNATAADWTHIEPLLDEAMHALDETDRAAVLLRYFENRSLREVGAMLGTTDDTARKRVSRAVEGLREFFAKRGVTTSASGLAVVISAHAVQAAPTGLAAAIVTAGPGTVIASNGTATALALLMTIQKKSLSLAIIVALLLGGMTTLLITRERRPAAFIASELTGKWHTKDGKESLEFLSDGTCQGRDRYGRGIKGSYVFMDDHRIRIDLTISTLNKAEGTVGIDRSSGVCGVDVRNNQLTLTDESGEAKRYTRMK